MYDFSWIKKHGHNVFMIWFLKNRNQEFDSSFKIITKNFRYFFFIEFKQRLFVNQCHKVFIPQFRIEPRPKV